MRGLLIIAALVLSSCAATEIEQPVVPARVALPPPSAEPIPQTEVRPVPELPDLAPAGGFARLDESPLSGRRSGLADDRIEQRLDCTSEPVPADRDVRNAFLRRCPPYDRN
jgi:hypothetical protein